MHTRIADTINHLAGVLGRRPAGSDAHNEAARWIRSRFEALGLCVEELPFDCPDHICHHARLECDGRPLPIRVNRHTPSCHLTAPVWTAQTLDELERAEPRGALLMLHGALTEQAFFPRNFTFFRVEAQDALLALVERLAPGALLFGTDQDVPPTRMEDSEYPLPNVTLPRESTRALLAAVGPATLELDTERRSSDGRTIVARTAATGPRLVLAAHYDTNHGTPGALDNASGVAGMLETAGLLIARHPALALECVAFGGEDSWYPGDALYFDDPDRIRTETRLFINLDGPGSMHVEHPVSLATFNLTKTHERVLDDALRAHAGIGRTDPWMQSDHAFAVALGIPTLAFSSPNLPLVAGLVHTPDDTPDKVDAEAIAGLCRMISETVMRLV
jgi:aminopeptidase YwaD